MIALVVSHLLLDSDDRVLYADSAYIGKKSSANYHRAVREESLKKDSKANH